MAVLNKDIVKEMEDYVRDSLGTDEISISYRNMLFFRIPAELAIEVGAAIYAFLLDWPELSDDSESLLDFLIEAKRVAERYDIDVIYGRLLEE